MTNPQEWYKGENRFGEEDPIKRLNSLIMEATYDLSQDLSKIPKVDFEDVQVEKHRDGDHLYLKMKRYEDPKELAVLDAVLYHKRISTLEWAANIHIFSNVSDIIDQRLGPDFINLGLNPIVANQYLNAYLTAGVDPGEVIDMMKEQVDDIKENPDRYAPQPERSTEYLAAAVETMRQIVCRHKFTSETFKIVYEPLLKLANRLSIFEPELSEDQRKAMVKDGMSEKEVDDILKEAKEHHEHYCKSLRLYKTIALLILEE